MTYTEIVTEVAHSMNLPVAFVNKVYRAYWKAIREHVTSLPLKKDLTDEQFKTLQPNINIPSIGKLYITLDRYKRVKQRYATYQQLKNKNDAKNKED